MGNAAVAFGGGVVQETGQVIGADPSSFRVRTARGTFLARRAVSCLVAPEVDDLVLVSTGDSGRAWVLAVLERDGDDVTLSSEGDLRIQLGSGRFAVVAQDGLSLASGDDVSVVGGRLDIKALAGDVVVHQLSYLGRAMQAEVDRVRTAVGSLDAVAERVTQRVQRSRRTVEELDEVRAGRIDYRALKHMSLRAKSTIMKAKQLLKMDGKQIHLG